MDSDKKSLNSAREDIKENINFPAEQKIDRYNAEVITIERRTTGNAVFQVDDTIFESNMPKPSHWSVAWSDLMMTMFILFLSMYVYQTAHQEFLHKQGKEIIGGDTATALDTLDISGASFPFVPIHPGLPLMTGGTIKKVERVEDDNLKQPQKEALPVENSSTPQTGDNNSKENPASSAGSDKIAIIIPRDEEKHLPTLLATQVPIPSENVTEPLPLIPEEPTASPDNSFQEIYTLSKNALEDNNLEKFASIDIVPDKTMRIILTSDLLFALGKSELSKSAQQSLHKIAAIIRYTPYMINVVGHTDNIPMKSKRFPSNWELSVARASTVVRFLIQDMDMDPHQFVASGFSSYRPLKPNTNSANRAKNRRVEIIISKQLPVPVQATAKNLQ